MVLNAYTVNTGIIYSEFQPAKRGITENEQICAKLAGISFHGILAGCF